MNFRSVLIVTYGRTGSTLLQGILNAIPGCVIRGENNNFCFELFNAWLALQRSKEHFGVPASRVPQNAWFGAADLAPAAFLAAARDAVERQLIPPDADGQRPACLGFKEIRYLPDNLRVAPEFYPSTLSAYLDFMAQLMPDPAVVFLTRQHDDVVRSAWWKDSDPVKLKASLRLFEQTVRAWRHKLCPSTEIRYEDVVVNGAVLADLFEFLGARHDAAAVQTVLSREHSFGSAPSGRLQLSRAPSLPAFMRCVEVDPFDSHIDPEHHFVWQGVAVPETGGQGLTLRVRLPDGRQAAVEWGLPSPRYGRRFPDLPSAGRARFKSPKLLLAGGQSVELVVCQGPEQHVLARVTRQSESGKA